MSSSSGCAVRMRGRSPSGESPLSGCHPEDEEAVPWIEDLKNRLGCLLVLLVMFMTFGAHQFLPHFTDLGPVGRSAVVTIGLSSTVAVTALELYREDFQAKAGEEEIGSNAPAAERPCGPQCGDKLRAVVTGFHDCGVFLRGVDVQEEIYIPTASLRLLKRHYSPGEELTVTVLRPRLLGGDRKKQVLATDRELRSLDSIEIGGTVDGLVVHINDMGLHLNIGTPKLAKCLWKDLAGVEKAPSEYREGDTVPGLVVKSIKKTWIQVCTPSRKFRDITDLQIGERLEGTVFEASTKLNAVFFDVGATDQVVAWGNMGHLVKQAQEYDKGEQAPLEVVEARGTRVRVKDRRTAKVFEALTTVGGAAGRTAS